MPAVQEKPVKTKAKKSVLGAKARAEYYRTKMDAEWGPYDLQHALDDRRSDVIVLDTRDADSFAKEHIAGAVNIPTDALAGRLNELPKNKEVVPYCWSIVCHLATRGALFLAEKGYVVHELAGGIEYWKNYKLPLEGTDVQK